MQSFRLAALASLAVIVFAPAASAADMPAKAPIYKAPPVATYDWTGFYLGGYYGGVISHAKTQTPFSALGIHDHNNSGVMGGVTAGYNWQFDRYWLVGVEGEIGYLGLDRTDTDWDDNTLVGVKAKWYGTARGRLGYVTGPSVLYGTGGAAFVNIENTFGGQSSANNGIPFIAPTTNSSTRTGWTIGGGIETKLSQNWSAKTEYLYIDAGDTSFTANVFPPSAPTTVNFNNKFHVIKSGLNYKFGGPNEGLPFFGAPMLPSDHNWAGLYAGVNAGVGISQVHTTGGEGAAPLGTQQDATGSHFTGGGQVGYNFMVTPRYFVGAEGDIGDLGFTGGDPGWNDSGRIFKDKTTWYGTARGRFGMSTGPALLYFTGGGAWVQLTDSITTGTLKNETSRTGSGWTIGGGTEVALNARWSAKLEALYIDVGHTQLAIGAVNTNFADRYTVVRAGLNLKIGD